MIRLLIPVAYDPTGGLQMRLITGKYYVKRTDAWSRTRVCDACDELGTLKSFEGFKIAHLNGIPLVPMGRRRVVDHCPRCENGVEDKPDDWNRERADAMQRIDERYRRDQDRVEFAIEALRLAGDYGRPDQEAEIVEHIEARLRDDPDASRALERWYRQHGREDMVAAMTDDGVLRAKADDNQARARALAAMEAEQLQSAKEHYLRIAEPRDELDFHNLAKLAAALIKSGADRQAHDVYAYLFRHFGGRLKGHTLIQQAVAKLEKKHNLTPSILPRSARPNRERNLIVALAVLAVIGAAGWCGWQHQHQRLFITNGTLLAADVVVNDARLTVEPGEIRQITLPEGQYDVNVTMPNGTETNTPIEIRNGPIDRFEVHNAFVFDVLGASVIVWEEVIYSDGNREGAFDVFAGVEFYDFHDLNYPFEDPPDSIRTDKRQEVRTVLYWPDEHPGDTVVGRLNRGNPTPHADYVAMAEGQIRGGNLHPTLISAYRTLCERQEDLARCDGFLSSQGLEAPSEPDRTDGAEPVDGAAEQEQ